MFTPFRRHTSLTLLGALGLAASVGAGACTSNPSAEAAAARTPDPLTIDTAVVESRPIDRFLRVTGSLTADEQAEVSAEATKEIGLAVLATTLSLIAIFVPVGFMGGIVGRFMTSFGFTMSFAILVSLLVSFTLTPMMAARWIKMKPGRAGMTGTKGSSKDSKFFRPLDAGYTAILQ